MGSISPIPRVRPSPAGLHSARSSRASRGPARCRPPSQCPAEPSLSPEEARHHLEEQLLSQISQGARLCAEVESKLSQDPAPELETLIKVYRVLILKLSLEANVAPELFKLASGLMKPVMDWARLQEKRRELELAEQKYRDHVEARKTAQAREARAQAGAATLSPETLEKIERELNLL